jgi:hypothetical protein
MSRDLDVLPSSPAVSALVRRIAFKLDAELRFNGHPGLSLLERSGWFALGEASAQLDRIAVLPGMATHEERARRDLLELYEVFDHSLPENPPALNAQERKAIEDAGDAQGCQP